MQKLLAAITFLLAQILSYAVNKQEILSPDGKIKLIVESKENLTYSISYQNRVILLPSIINLTLENGVAISQSADFKKTTTRFNKSVIVSPVPEKRKNIPDIYNELLIRLKTPYTVAFR